MSRRSRCAAIIAACVAVATAGGCSGTDSGTGASSKPIAVGGLLPLSGGGSVYGPDIETALRVAVDEINQNPPMGRAFDLHIADDQTDPDAGTRAAQKLISVNRVSAILGIWSSSVTLAVAPMAIQSGVMIGTAAGAGDVTKLDDRDLVWRFYPPGKYTGEAIAQAVKAQGWDSAVAMSRNDPSGLTIIDSFRKSFEAKGGKILDSITYPPSQSSYTGEVRKAIDLKADVIVNVGYTPELSAMLKDAANAPDKGTWLSVGWSVNGDLFKAVGDAAAEGIYSVDAAPNVDGGAYRHVTEAFQRKTGRELLPSNTFVFSAYDSAVVAALAMTACECTKGKELTDAIRKVSGGPGEEVDTYAAGVAALAKGADINYQGASSDLDFDDKGDQLSDYGIYQVRGGKIDLVQAFSLRTP